MSNIREIHINRVEHEKTTDAPCSVPLNQVAYKYKRSMCPEKVHPVGVVLMIPFMMGEKSSTLQFEYSSLHPPSKDRFRVSQTG